MRSLLIGTHSGGVRAMVVSREFTVPERRLFDAVGDRTPSTRMKADLQKLLMEIHPQDQWVTDSWGYPLAKFTAKVIRELFFVGEVPCRVLRADEPIMRESLLHEMLETVLPRPFKVLDDGRGQIVIYTSLLAVDGVIWEHTDERAIASGQLEE